MTRNRGLKNISKEKKTNSVLLALVLIYVLSFLLIRYIKFDYSVQFGYLDHQLYWEALHRLLDGQIIYKDFYWEYGPLYLYISAPLFLLLGKTFKGYIAIRLIFLPLLGFLLSYFLGRKILKGRWLILFLFLGALYSTVDFTSLRHIVAELGLVYTIIGLRNNNRKDILIGSFTLGLSLTAGIEYALLAMGALFLYLVWYSIVKYKKSEFKFNNILFSVSGIFIVGSLYFGTLAMVGSLSNFSSFFSQFSTSFLTFSPCRSQYPEISKFRAMFGSGFKNLCVQSRRWNLHLVPALIAFLLFYVAKKWKKIKFAPEMIILLLFSAGAYIRVMVNPCINILAYGMTPLLLVLVYLTKMSKKVYKKTFVVIIVMLILFSATSGPFDLINFLQKNLPDKSELSYMEDQKIYIDKEKHKKIIEISKYLKEITTENEYVYVYPYGPYNILTDTRSPSNVIISTHFELAPFLVEKVIENLEQKQPRIVVINEINTWSYLASMHQIPEDVLDLDGTPVFMSALTDVERYISQNYKVIKRIGKSLILERREAPIEYTPAYVKVEPEFMGESIANMLAKQENSDYTRYEITGGYPELRRIYKDMGEVNLIRLPVRGDKSLFKYSAVYLTNLFVLNLSNDLIGHNTDVLATEWQDMWLFYPDQEYLTNGAVVIFRLYKNKGFFDIGGFPISIDIKKPEFYKLNPILKSAIDEQKQFYN